MENKTGEAQFAKTTAGKNLESRFSSSAYVLYFVCKKKRKKKGNGIRDLQIFPFASRIVQWQKSVSQEV